MVKMFAKTIKNEKVQKTYKFELDEDFEIDHFYDYMKSVCDHFDSPTPIVLAKHIRDYIIFGLVTFRPDDFIEKVFFDKLVIETYKNL